MKFFNKKYLKIFLLLGVAYIISEFSINNVFLVNSPRLNPFFARNMVNKINNSWSKTGNFVASLNPFSSLNFRLFNNQGLSNRQNLQPSSISGFQPSVQMIANVKNSPQEIINALALPLTKVSSGVYAGENDGVKIYEVRLNEVEYLEYTFTIKGKEIKIKVPKGQTPPSQEIVESFYE